jgi:NAD(P)H-dependent FMN reductase
MGSKLFIPILLGSSREGRESAKVSALLHRHLKEHAEIETSLFDPRDMTLSGDEGQALKERHPELCEAVLRADGLILVAPEYNHGYPGSLKLVLDMMYREYVHRAVGLVGVSATEAGGTRCIEQLALVARAVGLVPTSIDLRFPFVQELFDAEGNLIDPQPFERPIDAFLGELVWMAKTLRWGRQNVPSKRHPLVKKDEG